MIERVERQRDVYLSLLEELDEIDRQQFARPFQSIILAKALIARQWLDLADKNDFESHRASVQSRGILVFRSNGYNGPWQIPKETLFWVYIIRCALSRNCH